MRFSFQTITTTTKRLSLGVPIDVHSINGYSRCSMYAVNFTQMLENGVREADPNWPTMPCKNGWEFDKDELAYPTISTEVSAELFFFFSITKFNFFVLMFFLS